MILTISSSHVEAIITINDSVRKMQFAFVLAQRVIVCKKKWLSLVTINLKIKIKTYVLLWGFHNSRKKITRDNYIIITFYEIQVIHKSPVRKIARRSTELIVQYCWMFKNFLYWKQIKSVSLETWRKKDVNRDSHIASSSISQSSFFKGVRCLILASSQRKLRGYIEFL